MNWKLFFKRVLIIGILLIPLNLFYELLSVSIFYKKALPKDVILIAGISLLAAVSIFRFVYRRAEKFKIIQALATIPLSWLAGYVLMFAGVLVLLRIVS